MLPAIVIAALLGLGAGTATALQVVRTVNATVLGQPLDFSAGIRLEAGEELTPDCVQADVIVGDRPLPSQAVRVALDGSGAERRVRVRTVVPVDEPIAQVVVKLGCPMRFSRSFVAFVDPPGVQLPQAAPTPTAIGEAAPPADRVSTGSGAAAASALGPQPPADVAAPRSSRSPDGASGSRPRVQRPVAVARAPDAAARPTGGQAAAPARERARPRLRLEPIEPVSSRSAAETGVSPTTAPGTGSGSSAAPPAAALPGPTPEAAASAVAADAALRALELALEQMRSEAAETQRAVAVLQARLVQAEQQRAPNPALYALVIAVLGLAMALLIVAGRLRQARQERSQWAPSVAAESQRPLSGLPEQPTELAGGGDTRLSGPATQSTQPAAAPAFLSSATASLDALAAPAETARGAQTVPRVPAAEVRREVTVEELIDLEQQAEFFVVLGQDEAAIDVLMGHLRSTGGQTPLPYLKLLEIYRRREDREAYERIRERFNRRFNAYAPEWGADLQRGRSLEDYPVAITRLQQVWPDPIAAMELLEQSLLRQGEDIGTYDLPAYREVLFLYSVARDLAERRQPESVDLLLPLAEDVTAPAAFDTTGYGRTGPGGVRDFETGLDMSGTDFGRSTRYETDFSFDTGGLSDRAPSPPPRLR